MNVLAYCNTYAQLLCVLQMKNTLFQNDCLSVVLSDHSNDSQNIYERLKSEKMCAHVFYWKSKGIDYANKMDWKQLTNIISVITGKGLCNGWSGKEYDLFLYYNYSLSASILFAQLYAKNIRLRCARFEEGITSYNQEINLPYNRRRPQKLKLAEKLRKLTGNPGMCDRTYRFYCYYPELYHGNLEIIEIPKISMEDVHYKDVIKRVFSVKDEVTYPQKYIYFGCIGDVEGGQPIGELELVKKIAEKMGAENVLVKAHPRDNAKKYEEAGLRVDRNSSLPWEVIQLCRDFSDHVFISAISSSVLSANMIVEKPAKVYFAYKLCKCENNVVAKDAIVSIDSVLEMCENKTSFVSVINSLDEIQ